MIYDVKVVFKKRTFLFKNIKVWEIISVKNFVKLTRVDGKRIYFSWDNILYMETRETNELE